MEQDSMTLMQLVSAINWTTSIGIWTEVVAYQTEDPDVWIVQAWFEGIESAQVATEHITQLIHALRYISTDNCHADLRFHGDW